MSSPLLAAVPDDEEVGTPVWMNLMQPFFAVSVDPLDQAARETLPVVVTVTLNRAVRVATVNNSTVMLKASGGDGSFAEGNEVALTPTGISAQSNIISIDLSGVVSADDDYQLSLLGTGGSPIKGSFGLTVLDGNNDGRPGGDFISVFNVTAPPAGPIPTLAEVQALVFTPNCALGGCHSGITPQQGMNLSAGQTWSNTVNVPSNQLPSLDRIEPGNPDDSYLVRKIEGSGLLERMPRLRPALLQSQIDMVRDWISGGAGDSPPGSDGDPNPDPGPGPPEPGPPEPGPY